MPSVQGNRLNIGGAQRGPNRYCLTRAYLSSSGRHKEMTEGPDRSIEFLKSFANLDDPRQQAKVRSR